VTYPARPSARPGAHLHSGTVTDAFETRFLAHCRARGVDPAVTELIDGMAVMGYPLASITRLIGGAGPGSHRMYAAMLAALLEMVDDGAVKQAAAELEIAIDLRSPERLAI
jgi:hypothetical protein